MVSKKEKLARVSFKKSQLAVFWRAAPSKSGCLLGRKEGRWVDQGEKEDIVKGSSLISYYFLFSAPLKIGVGRKGVPLRKNIQCMVFSKKSHLYYFYKWNEEVNIPNKSSSSYFSYSNYPVKWAGSNWPKLGTRTRTPRYLVIGPKSPVAFMLKVGLELTMSWCSSLVPSSLDQAGFGIVFFSFKWQNI